MENESPLLNNDLKRNNEDKCLNTYGKLLLEMCKSKKLLIVNGRIVDFVREVYMQRFEYCRLFSL